MACRLIAFDKKPGVRPIGIGDTSRRIIAKAILRVTRQDIQELCAGQISGTEAAVHAARTLFNKDDTELVDASNAALHNICPSVLINTLFVDGDTLISQEGISQEGTTQGDPLAPLIKKLKENVNHVWYADDASGSGTINQWWDQTNPSKTRIVLILQQQAQQ